MVGKRAMVWGPLLGLLGCAGSGGEDTAVVACNSAAGTLEGVVYEDFSWNEPEPGEEPVLVGHARVQISQSDVEPFTAMADADGYYSVDLQAGVWSIYATDSVESCVSEWGLSVEVVACETAELDVALIDCLLGR
ncbi:MAG: hypothetical protein VX519_01815 [Myxococcota bacterium]|nr:hypothetical protein [Myxococcota bacterium]